MSRSPSPSKLYKRNQVEGVLWALLSGPFRSADKRLTSEPPSYFKARLKRLLETDVMLGRTLGAALPEYGMAFFEDIPKGKGHDVGYAPRQVFVLAIGLELVRFGCKPKEVVEALAECRHMLRRAFDKIPGLIEASGRTRLNKIDSESGQCEAVFLILRHLEAARTMDLPMGHVSEGETFLNAQIANSRAELHELIDQTIPTDTTQLLVMELAEMSARITELLKILPARARGVKVSCGLKRR